MIYDTPLNSTWSPAPRQNYLKVADSLSGLDIRSLVNGRPDLLLEQAECRQQAENVIWHLAHCNDFTPSVSSEGRQLWGSDSSMVPAAVRMMEHKNVTTAITGPQTLVVRTLGCNSSILQGELMGMVLGLILADNWAKTPSLYSDHMNSVRLINDSRTSVDQQS
jgi:hypothetical protein